ncbi:STAS domain-containing protein [Streptomyces sp. NPDC046939]|uniref:STAS domain-containing protein n=1 Tax=Streptomyces sp. NPDC046939 TaxID=3155376 RepID=UPI0033DF912F
MSVSRTPDTPGYFMVLAVCGELDVRSVPTLCDLVSEVLAEGSRHLLVDLSAVTRCDNAALYTLSGVRQALHEMGGSLSLGNPSPSVQRALARKGVRTSLPLHDDAAVCT